MTPISEKVAKAAITAIEKALALGFPPPDRKRHRGEPSAISKAAEALEITSSTLHSRVEQCWNHYGLRPDWRKWKEKIPVEETPIDHIAVRRERDQRTAAEARATAAERAAVSAVSLREAVFRLVDDPPEPPEWRTPAKSKEHASEALILPISDPHMGEVVDLQQMGGRNSYNKEIAKRRLERLFQQYVKMGTTHWTGPAPEVIYLVLMGDLISGIIHEELAKTNDLLSIPSVKTVTECIIAGINLLLEHFECPINVISIPGNHSRLTRKPESKDFAIDSFDTLVAWNIESWFAAREVDRVRFSAPASGDALVTIHGWNFLFTHGDRMGSKGGMGFVGPAATIARGMQKIIQDYAADGIIVDYVITAHFHTALELEQGFACGTPVGPSEFSKSFRARPRPATQWFLSCHPQYGIARRWLLQLGAPEEGSLYRGRM